MGRNLRPPSAAHTPHTTHPMQECIPSGQTGARVCSEEARITCSVLLPHSRSACCYGCSYALRMASSASYSHRSDKVSVVVPLAPTACDDSAWPPLSRAVVLVCCFACSCLFMLPVCSSCARSATHGRPRDTSTAASAATVTTSSTATRQMQLQHLLPLPLLLRLHRCSTVTITLTAI